MKKILLPQFIVLAINAIIISTVITINYEVGATILFLILYSASIALAIHGAIQYIKSK